MVVGGSSALPTSYYPPSSGCSSACLGPVSSGMQLLGLFTYIYCFFTYIYLSAAGVTGARVLHGPTAPVTSSVPVACFYDARSKCVDS